MRTDCKISTRKKIHCVNATSIGFGKYMAEVGDLIVYKEHYNDDSYGMRTARMIGSVTAPKVDPADAVIKDWLLVLTLSDDCHTCFERWVNPIHVVEVTNPPTQMVAWFFQEKLPYDVNTLRRLNVHGSLTNSYIENAEDVVQRWATLAKKR